MLVTTYQIAETLGLTAEQVRETITPSEMCEWGVFLNSPFSLRGRESLMNGWLVHVIRSIMADKRNKPKFSDSLFPFEKLAKEYFTPPKGAANGKNGPGSVGEVMHMAQVLRQQYEKMLEDYKAGKIPNKYGLYINEQIRK